MRKHFTILCILFLLVNFFGISNTYFFDWLGASTSPENVGTEIEAVFAPKPVATKEDKFLEEAKEHIKMSPLDICQHKIMLKLKASCSVLSEEALLKMSVNLLNCQSEAEGRKKIPCTEEMTLKECTKTMDPGIWNLYHLMSVRAKSVCYLTRQQQFNAYTDMMLSRLTLVAQDQTATMKSLEQGQEKLQAMAHETYNFLKKAQERLKIMETKATSQLKMLDDSIVANMDVIKAQEELLTEAQKQLTEHVEQIKNAFVSSEAKNVNGTKIEKLQLDALSMLNTFKTESEARWKKFGTTFVAADTLLQKITLQKEELAFKVNSIRNVTECAVSYATDVVNDVIYGLSWLFCFTCKAEDHEAQVWCYVHHILLSVANVVLWLLICLDFRIFILVTYFNFMIYYWRMNFSPKPSSLTMEIFLFITGQYLIFKIGKFFIATKQFFSAAVSSGSIWNLIPLLLKGEIVNKFKKRGHGQRVQRGLRLPAKEEALHPLQHSRSSTPPNGFQHSRSPTPSHASQHSRSRTPSNWLPPSTSDSPVHLRSSTPLPTSAGFSSQVSAPPRWPRLLTSRSQSHEFTSVPPSYLSDRKQETLSPKYVCRAVCKTGKPCRNPVVVGEELCRRHLQ